MRRADMRSFGTMAGLALGALAVAGALAGAGAVAGVGGCTLIPEYDRPAAPVPERWPEYAATRPATGPAAGAATGPAAAGATAPADAARLPWREFIGDENLRRVVETALANNRDLRLAALNVRRTQGLYGIRRNELLPAFDASAGMIRRRVPGDLSSGGEKTTIKEWDVNLGLAAWEIDLFGRIRSLSEEALQQYLATEQARRGVQVLLVAEVATTYLALAADRESLRLARSTLETQQGMRELVRRRAAGGVVADLDLYRAQTQVDTARRNVAIFAQRVMQDENALTLLAGAPVSGDLLPADLAHVVPPREIGAGVSSEVLLSRPDILAAEHRLMAANANIGAARAAFFPRISLTASVGTASTELSGLFGGGSGTWSYAPQVVMPVFDARTWSALEVSQADRELAVANYERAIQAGFREVADALAVRANVGEQVAAQESLVRAVGETYRLSSALYDRGVASYLDVLDAQRSLYSAQEGLIALQFEKLANQVRIYAVLGGGWRESSDTGGASEPSSPPAPAAPPAPAPPAPPGPAAK